MMPTDPELGLPMSNSLLRVHGGHCGVSTLTLRRAANVGCQWGTHIGCCQGSRVRFRFRVKGNRRGMWAQARHRAYEWVCFFSLKACTPTHNAPTHKHSPGTPQTSRCGVPTTVYRGLPPPFQGSAWPGLSPLQIGVDNAGGVRGLFCEKLKSPPQNCRHKSGVIGRQKKSRDGTFFIVPPECKLSSRRHDRFWLMAPGIIGCASCKWPGVLTVAARNAVSK